MTGLEICAAINPVLLIVILVLMVVRKFEVTSFDYILLWLIAFLNVTARTLGVFIK